MSERNKLQITIKGYSLPSSFINLDYRPHQVCTSQLNHVTTQVSLPN